MGNLESHFSKESLSEPADEFFHLQRPISVLHLRVDPQQIQAFALAPDDVLELQLLHDQSIELIVRDRNAQHNFECIQMLDSPISMKMSLAENTLAQLHQYDQTALRLRKQLNQMNIQEKDLENVIRLEYTASIQFKALETVEIIVLNTGLNMRVDEQSPIDEVKVIVKKAVAAFEFLPPPLATPIQEIRIACASAQTYTVKAGQWIQIIDVAGKQCSDFIAFDAKALENGQEIGLDAVATRSILGYSTPTPGLHSRFYAENLEALVEVVQDMVGRHDMFLTACTPKFYSDSGYFGHRKF